MKLNVKNKFTETTHEGAPAASMTAVQALRRSVCSCLLWEKEFYEDGQTIADRIMKLSAMVEPAVLADLALEARSKFNLRHVPLLLLKALIKHGEGQLVTNAIANTIQRADELTELLAVYWSDGRKPLSNPLRKGLAKAFLKFNEYQLAKYNRDGAVKLRDVLFLCHAKPDTPEREALWKRLAENELATPNTWEVGLSSGADKQLVFESLIAQGQLGYLALLRNLRNMDEAGCDPILVKQAILARKNGAERVLPFRYVAAARAAPRHEKEINLALQYRISLMPQLRGTTIVLVDVSGSMEAKLSAKSDMTRMDAAAALASMIDGDVRVFTFSNLIVEVPHRLGMAGVDAINKSQPHQGTYLGMAIDTVNKMTYDRLIVITDEQSHDRVTYPKGGKGYMINVASAKNGVGYGPWTHIDGFSEAVLTFIHEHENMQ